MPSDWRSFDAVAEIYERVRAPIHVEPARDLVQVVAPAAGSRVLDIGTGTGVAAELAQAAVGPSGLVVGIDPSVPMLRLAMARHHRVIAAESIDLPFRNETFDAAIASFVIAFFTKYDTALFDVLRVLRPGGRLGVTWWTGDTDEFVQTWNGLAERYATKELVRDAVRRAMPWDERFRDRRQLEATLRDVGLREVQVRQRKYRSTVSQEDYLAGREANALGRFLRETLGEQLWGRFREETATAFRERFPDPLGDTNDVLIAVGTKD